jgi:hypothetical protein
MRTSARLCARGALAALLAAASALASACGFCVEDRVAAVYDHEGVGSAIAQRQHVAFFALEGPLASNPASRRAIVAALESAGALPGTARVAVENAACSAAYDPRRTSLAELAKRANKPLAARGLTLVVLRMIDAGGALKEPQ